jgi:purine-nucleoside phosphorylase
MKLIDRLSECEAYLNNQTNHYSPTVGIILGTGLGGLVNEIAVDFEIPYSDIPGFVEATVEFHPGKLIFGKLGGKKVVCMSGRFHYYEGYSMEQVTFPVRVMKLLGIKYLFISNAAGGMNPDFEVSDLMIIEDHISLFLPENPLRGECILGDRFPDMSEPYSLRLIRIAEEFASKHGITSVRKGVYVSVPGPHLESRAEYRMLRTLGGDAVGMSTVPEALVAIQMGLEVFAVSVITDMGIPETLQKAEITKILEAARKAEPALTRMLGEIIQQV